MELPEEFQTLSTSFETKFKEKGSLFIGQAYPVLPGVEGIVPLNKGGQGVVVPLNKGGEGVVVPLNKGSEGVVTWSDAEYILDSIRKKYYDATHHCYGLSLNGGMTKYSDAGEPSGTAGIRILNAIQHFKLQNVLVVVIRYFGGVKLGVGPLGKAYYNSAFITLEAAPKIVKTVYKKFKIIFDFQHLGQAHHLLSLFQVKEMKNIYTDKTEIEFLLKMNSESAFTKKKEELLRDNAELVDTAEIIFM